MLDLCQKNETVAITRISPHPQNYKIHSPRQIEQLKASLTRFGQVRSVVIQEQSAGDYVTVAGHGVLEAAKKLKWASIKADILPASWDEVEVRGYLIADNQHALSASDDEYLLAQLLEEQKGLGIELASLGSSEQELRELYQSIENSHVADFLTPYLTDDEPSVFARPTFPAQTFTAHGEEDEQDAEEATTPLFPPLTQRPLAYTENIQYFPVTYSLTLEQRTVVFDAVRKAKETWNLGTSQEALVAICQRYSVQT
jgi:hypothetical protein